MSPYFSLGPSDALAVGSTHAHRRLKQNNLPHCQLMVGRF